MIDAADRAIGPRHVEEVSEFEVSILRTLAVRKRLERVCRGLDGLRAFASAFYFIRCDFVRINFLVGARCNRNEFEWGGLARNLYEELGGGQTKAHNQLYRDFLKSVGVEDELALVEPTFARRFNDAWEAFAVAAPVPLALLGVAAYEILDIPDYGMMCDALLSVAPYADLTFFKVHSCAEHFALFDELIGARGGDSVFDGEFATAAAFVLNTQSRMWSDLLLYLEGQESLVRS